MNLFEINAAIEDAIERMLDSVDPETGEVNEEDAKALEELQAAKKDKLDNIGAFIKNLQAEAEALSEEATGLPYSECKRKLKENDWELWKAMEYDDLLPAFRNLVDAGSELVKTLAEGIAKMMDKMSEAFNEIIEQFKDGNIYICPRCHEAHIGERAFDEFGRPICKTCFKMEQLKDERDWEDER